MTFKNTEDTKMDFLHEKIFPQLKAPTLVMGFLFSAFFLVGILAN